MYKGLKAVRNQNFTEIIKRTLSKRVVWFRTFLRVYTFINLFKEPSFGSDFLFAVCAYLFFFLINFLFWSNFRFTEKFKNSTDSSHITMKGNWVK